MNFKKIEQKKINDTNVMMQAQTPVKTGDTSFQDGLKTLEKQQTVDIVKQNNEMVVENVVEQKEDMSVQSFEKRAFPDVPTKITRNLNNNVQSVEDSEIMSAKTKIEKTSPVLNPIQDTKHVNKTDVKKEVNSEFLKELISEFKAEKTPKAKETVAKDNVVTTDNKELSKKIEEKLISINIEPKTQAKTEIKNEAKPEVVVQPKAEVKVQPRVEVETVSEVKPQIKPELDVMQDVVADVKPELEVQPKMIVQEMVENKVQTGMNVQIKAENNVQTEMSQPARTELEVEPEVIAQVKSEQNIMPEMKGQIRVENKQLEVLQSVDDKVQVEEMQQVEMVQKPVMQEVKPVQNMPVQIQQIQTQAVQVAQVKPVQAQPEMIIDEFISQESLENMNSSEAIIEEFLPVAMEETSRVNELAETISMFTEAKLKKDEMPLDIVLEPKKADVKPTLSEMNLTKVDLVEEMVQEPAILKKEVEVVDNSLVKDTVKMVETQRVIEPLNMEAKASEKVSMVVDEPLKLNAEILKDDIEPSQRISIPTSVEFVNKTETPKTIREFSKVQAETPVQRVTEQFKAEVKAEPQRQLKQEAKAEVKTDLSMNRPETLASQEARLTRKSEKVFTERPVTPTNATPVQKIDLSMNRANVEKTSEKIIKANQSTLNGVNQSSLPKKESILDAVDNLKDNMVQIQSENQYLTNEINNYNKTEKAENRAVVSELQSVLAERVSLLDEISKTVTSANEVREIKQTLKSMDTPKVAKSNKDVETKSLKMTEKDANFFADLIKQNQVQQSVNTQTASTIQDVQNVAETEHSATVSKALADMLSEAAKTNKPFRIDFDKDISVIIKVDREGRISAEFIPGDTAVEQFLRNSMPLLRQRFDDQQLDYKNLDYRQSKNQNRERKNNRENKGE